MARAQRKTEGLHKLACLLLVLLLGTTASAVTLGTVFPSSGQAGVTFINVTASNFIDKPSTVTVLLTPVTGGIATPVTPSSVTPLTGTTYKISFVIPKSILVIAPTRYQLGLSGRTVNGFTFVSENVQTLTINPASSVLLSPNSAPAGTTLDVNIIGSFTDFLQGVTAANFGPGSSVEGSSMGAAGPVQVTSPTSATARVALDSSAATGVRNIVVKTGTQQASATFNVLAQDPGDPQPPPVANAGPQQLVAVGSTVHLDGSASTSGAGGSLQYHWTFLSKPGNSTATLSDPDSVQPTFVADRKGDYVVQLVVTEGAKSSAASATITTINTAPVAEAGPAQVVALGSTVQLDGSHSTDVDGDSLTYQWQLIQQPAGSTASLSDASSVIPTFVADVAGTYVVQLTVNDNHNHTATDTVSITTENAPPTANAGNPQTVHVGATVQLDGSKSSDPDHDTLSYSWSFTSKPSGATAAISDAASASPTFIADVLGTYVVQLTVNDGHGHTAAATVRIDTQNSPPTANAGAPQTILAGNAVQLDGSSSSDPDNDSLTFSWSLLSKPFGSGAQLNATDIAKPIFLADLPGQYVGQLIVFDGIFSSAPSTVLVTATAPQFSANPGSVDFGDQPVNTTSGSRQVVLANTGNSPLVLSSLSLKGADAQQFALSAPSVPITLAEGQSTTIDLTFSPTSNGPKAAAVEVADNSSGSPHLVPLLGRGVSAVIGLDKTSVAFGSQAVGVRSAENTVRVVNLGNQDLVISALDLTGNHASDFEKSLAGALPLTLSPGAGITIALTFRPTALGPRSATLQLTHNAAGGSHSIALSGTGTGPAISITPLSVNFGDQALSAPPQSKPVVIANAGNDALVISGLTLEGPGAGSFKCSKPLPITVAPGENATLNVSFEPAASGSYSASLAIADNSPEGKHSVALAGVALAPGASVSPATLAFGNQQVGTTSSPANFTVTNTGGADLVITDLAIAGANAGAFTHKASLPITIQPGRNLAIGVVFAPSAGGAHSATLTLVSNAEGTPASVALSGTGVSPTLELNPTSLAFDNQALNTTSAPKQVSLTNTGTGNLSISSVAVIGRCAPQFAFTPLSVPITLPAGQGITIGVRFTPVELTACDATLVVASNDPAGARSVALSGTAVGVAALTFTPASLSFGNQVLNKTSAGLTGTLGNAGQQPLVISDIRLSGQAASDFSLSAPALPITLLPGAHASVSLTFTPSALGPRVAELQLTYDGFGSPRTVPVTGTGTAPALLTLPSAVDFGLQEVNVNSPAKTVVLVNSGTADLVISGLALSSAVPEFQIASAPLPITLAPSTTTNVTVTFRPGSAAAYAASLLITDNASGSPHTVPISGTGGVPLISIVPASLAFDRQPVNTTSDPKAITIANPGSVDLIISNATLGGAHASDFLLNAVLPIVVPAGGSTSLSVRFRPSATGTRTATVTLADNASGNPHTIPLSGEATADATTAEITPASLTFVTQSIGTTSPAQLVTVRNTGARNMVISEISVTGSAAADFAVVAVLPITVAPGTSFAIPVTFGPRAVGTRTATLALSDNAAGSPHSVALLGTSTGTPAINLLPAAVNFGGQNVGEISAARVVTVENTGTDNLVISKLNIMSPAGATDFQLGDVALPLTVAPGGSVQLPVSFKPVVPGNRTGILTITDNASGSPHTVTLSGTGTVPMIDVAPQLVTFGSEAANHTSSPRSLTVTNTGTGPLVISNLTVTGTNSADFVVVPLTLPITVSPGSSAKVTLTFTPGATGARSAILVLTHNAGAGTTSIPVGGTGILAGPAVNVLPAAVVFGNQQVNTTSGGLTLTLENPGTENLLVSKLSIAGANPGDFSYSAPALPITVIPGGTAQVYLAFTPSSASSRTASLSISHNAAGSPTVVPLSGTGVAPVISIKPASIDFGRVQVKTSSTPVTVEVSNAGTGTLRIFDLSISGASEFSLTAGALPITVAPGASTQITVIFAPKKKIAHSAALVISDNASGTPHSVALSGTGVGSGAIISLEPASISLPPQTLNTSTTTPLAISNLGTGALKISQLAISGDNANEFAIVGPSLPAVIPPGNTIQASIRFLPTAKGTRSAVLNLVHDADAGPDSVPLTGTGTASGPAINVVPWSVDFGAQRVNSASMPAVVVVENTGNDNLTISKMTVSGANGSEFAVNGPAMPVVVPAGGSVPVTATFAPTAPGARSATLSIESDAAGAPHAVALSGSGTAPVINVNPAALDFGNQVVLTASAPKTLVITNVGSAPLTITGIDVAPPTVQFPVAKPFLPLTLAPGGSVSVSVLFGPTAAISYSTNLVISHDGVGSPTQVPLSGTGVVPGISFSPSSVQFGNQQLNTTSPPSNITVTNTGTATLVISKIEVSGTNAADFSVGAATLPISVAPGASTVVQAAFTPHVLGPRSASLTFTTNVLGSPQSVPLSGSGGSPSGITLNPASLSFGNQGVNTTSALKSIAISNSGSSSLVISGLTIVGTNSADFTFVAPTLPITMAPGATVTLSVSFAPLALGPRSAALQITDSAAGSPHFVPLTGTGVGAATATVTPTSINFGTQAVNTTSAATNITLTNTGTVDLMIGAVTIAGTNASDFAMTGGAFPTTLSPGNSVVRGVTFRPTAAGTRSGTLSISTSASGSPHTISLTGVGASPGISVVPSAVNFGNQVVGQTSAPTVIEITNTGSGDLVISSVTMGGANSSEFRTDPVTLPLTISPGAKSRLNVTFTPAAVGSRWASLTLQHNASGGVQVIPLVGSGTAPAISISPTSLNFGNQPVDTAGTPQTVTISNAGQATLNVSSIALQGTNAADFTVTSEAVPLAIAPGSSKTVSVSFRPSASGSRSATLVITHDAPGSPQSVTLAGTGVVPIINVSPTSLDFGSQVVDTTTSPLVVTVSNLGNANLVVSAVSISGANAGDFAVSGTTLPLTLTPNAKLSLSVTFTPKAAGSRAATLNITQSGNSTPATVSLSGTGTTVPGFSISPTSLTFSAQTVGTASTPKQLVISNPGTGNLVVSSLTLSGGNPSDFSVEPLPLPLTIAPGATATLNVTFAPAAGGSRWASLSIVHNAAAQPQTVLLTGVATEPVISITPASLNFGNQAVGTSGTPTTVTIANSGQGTLLITSIVIQGANAADFAFTPQTLPLSIAPASSKTIPVTFQPTTSGSRSATLVISDNAAGTPHAVALSGTGIAPVLSVSPSSINFGSQRVSTTGTAITATLSNTGNATLVISALGVTGANAADFQISSSPPLPISISPGQSTTVGLKFSPTATGARSASLSITNNNTGTPFALPLNGTGTVPAVALDPDHLSFTGQALGTTSDPKAVTLTNTGTAPLLLTTINISGTNASEFSLQAGALPMTIAAGDRTVIQVRFTPQGSGVRTASLTISSDAPGSPHTVPLSGSSVLATLQLSTSTMDFGTRPVGSTSSPSTLTITSSGSGDLIVSSITIEGANASDFSVTGGATPLTVSPGSFANLDVRFTPSAAGSRSASLKLVSNATGSPHFVALSGVGTAPAVSAMPNPVAFPNQRVGTTSVPISFTITNSGSADLIISSLTLTGANASDFSLVAFALPRTIAPGQSASLDLRFTPTAAGLRAASLSVGDNAPGSPQTFALSGTGTQPGIAVNPTSGNFGQQAVNVTSTPLALTVSNPGTADLTISSISLTGTNSGDFAFIAGALPIAVAPGGNTVISVTFTPQAMGTRAATLTIAHDVPGSPLAVALSGTGSQPVMGLSTTSIAFGNQPVNTTSAASPLTLTNQGNGTLVISNVALTGTDAGDFSFTPNTLPIQLAPGASVTLQVTFAPKTIGNKAASLVITHNAAGSPNTLPLSGTGTGAVLAVDPNPVQFGNRAVNTTSPPTTMTLRNLGNVNLVISNIAVTGTNASEFALAPVSVPITVVPGANVTVSLTFTPAAAGGRSAILVITSNAAGSPQSVPLSGTGLAPGFSSSQSNINFGNQNVNTATSPVVVTITNTGTGDLVISNIAVTGTNPADFSFTSAALPITVPGSGTTNVSVTFKPVAPGNRSASLSITTNATGSPHTITMSGTGTVPVIDLNPSSINFSSQPIDTTTSTNLTVKNVGTGSLVISSVSISGNNSSEFSHNAVTPITLAPGASQIIAVSFSPTQAGTRSATLTLTSNANGSPHNVALSGVGVLSGRLAVNAFTVGKDLEVLATAAIDNPAPSGGITVTITSLDPTKLLLATDPVSAGQATVTAMIPANGTAIFPGFWAHGLVSSGAAQVRVSSPGYVPATATVSFTPSGFVLSAGQGTNFTTTLGVGNTALTVTPAALDSSNAVITGIIGRVRGGLNVSVTVTSGTPSVGTIEGSPVAFAGGSTSGTASFHPVAAGTSVISVVAPPGFATPSSGAQLTATVQQPNISLNPLAVGANLQAGSIAVLQAPAPSGGTSITITSSDPSKVKVSANPQVEGSGSVVLPVAQGQTTSPTFYVQAIAGAGASGQLTASAPGYVSHTADVVIIPSGFVIVGPDGVAGQSFSTSTIAPAPQVRAMVMELTSQLVPINAGQIRGGLTVNVPIISSDTSVGTINNSPAVLQPGDSANRNTVTFRALSLGNTILSLGTPSVTGFSTPTTNTTLTATVTQPQITIGIAATTIGKDLQVRGSGSLSAPAPSGGLQITIHRTSGTAVLLSTSPTAQGSDTIIVTVPAGSTGGGLFPAFYVQATDSTGTATITADAPGWQSSSITIQLAPSGFALIGLNGMGQDFGTPLNAGSISLGLEAWQLNATTFAPENQQSVRGGFSVSVPVATSDSAIATIGGTPANIAGGSSSGTVTFVPLARGSTTVTLTEPSGFSTPMVNNNPVDRLTVFVN